MSSVWPACSCLLLCEDHRRGGKEVSLSCRKILAGLIKRLCRLTNCILASDPVEA